MASTSAHLLTQDLDRLAIAENRLRYLALPRVRESSSSLLTACSVMLTLSCGWQLPDTPLSLHIVVGASTCPSRSHRAFTDLGFPGPPRFSACAASCKLTSCHVAIGGPPDGRCSSSSSSSSSGDGRSTDRRSTLGVLFATQRTPYHFSISFSCVSR